MSLKHQDRLNDNKVLLLLIVMLLFYMVGCNSKPPQDTNGQSQEIANSGNVSIPEKIYVPAASDEDGWRDYFFASKSLEEWKDSYW